MDKFALNLKSLHSFLYTNNHTTGFCYEGWKASLYDFCKQNAFLPSEAINSFEQGFIQHRTKQYNKIQPSPDKETRRKNRALKDLHENEVVDTMHLRAIAKNDYYYSLFNQIGAAVKADIMEVFKEQIKAIAFEFMKDNGFLTDDDEIEF